ncbi:MAG: hypothetical protein ACI9VR_002986, partial [Cognaticolwellia sp.]
MHMPLRQHLQPWLRARIVEAADRALKPLKAERQALWPAVENQSRELDQLDSKLQATESDLAAFTAPFSPTMTVHQAWMRHPGVRAIFVRHHLPDCPSCPVGADERLEEAAFGYGIPLEPWLAE